MLIWFAVASALLVALVFQSAGVDHRWVMAGAVLPLVEAATGGPKVLHSVVGAAVLLVAAVLATRRRRLLRRRVLGVPIGMMAHLILDGSFATRHAFWWPLFGVRFASGQVPEVAHWPVSVVLEVVGIGAAIWAYGNFGLRDPARRQRFLRDGRLEVPARPAMTGRRPRR